MWPPWSRPPPAPRWDLPGPAAPSFPALVWCTRLLLSSLSFIDVLAWRLGELIIYIGGLRIDVNYLCLCPAGIALALLLLLFLCWCGVLGFVCNWSVLYVCLVLSKGRLLFS